jgi:hypothetical protein
MRDVAAGAGVIVVHAQHFVTRFEQTFREKAAEKTGRAGNEDTLRL